MPFQQAAAALGVIGQAASNVYDIQLKQLQHTQRAQSTLAMQQNLRELDQIFIQKLQNQLSNADPQQRITEDWLNEDFRQQRLREMFDERMQEVRGMVSTPEGQMELETRAESMWQQYEFGWRDKSIEAMRAWDLQAGQSILEGYSANAQRDDVEQWVAMGNEHIRSMVSSGSLRPELMDKWMRDFNRMTYDGVAREEIADPRRTEKEGGPFSDYDIDGMHAHSAAFIDSLVSSRKIEESHAKELRKVNDSVREKRRENIYLDYSEEARDVLRAEALQRAMRGEFVDLYYGEWITAFQGDERYEVIGREFQSDFAADMNREIGWLNRMLNESKGTEPHMRPLHFLAERVLHTEDTRSYEEAIALFDRENPNSAWNLAMQMAADDQRARYELEKYRQTEISRLREQQQDFFRGNEQMRNRFHQILSVQGIHPDSTLGRDLAKQVWDLAGAQPGREQIIDDELLTQWSRGFYDKSITDSLQRGVIGRLLGQDAATVLGREGFQMKELIEGLGAISASEVNASPIGWAMTEIVKQFYSVVSRDGSGRFKAEDLLAAVERMVYPPEIDRKDLSPEVKQFADTLYVAAAVLFEAMDLGGKVVMENYQFDGGYELSNVLWNYRDNIPVFSLIEDLPLSERVDGRETRQFYFQINAADPDNIRFQRLTRDGDGFKVNYTLNYNEFSQLLNTGGGGLFPSPSGPLEIPVPLRDRPRSEPEPPREERLPTDTGEPVGTEDIPGADRAGAGLSEEQIRRNQEAIKRMRMLGGSR